MINSSNTQVTIINLTTFLESEKKYYHKQAIFSITFCHILLYVDLNIDTFSAVNEPSSKFIDALLLFTPSIHFNAFSRNSTLNTGPREYELNI